MFVLDLIVFIKNINQKTYNNFNLFTISSFELANAVLNKPECH